jgi:prepilin-type N-terminal cleavage/methylation domain-containing protein
MFKNIKLNRDGFTIVETLIVLAIAAVIIIIILLAVPALQRSQRNSDIKTDATTVTGEISDYESNNGGTLPVSIAVVNGSTLTVGSTPPDTNASTAKIGNGDSVMLFGVAGTVTYTVNATQSATAMGPSQINVYKGSGCPDTSSGASLTTFPANSRAYAVVYPYETSSSNGGLACIQA